MNKLLLLSLALGFVALGCTDDDPEETPIDTGIDAPLEDAPMSDTPMGDIPGDTPMSDTPMADTPEDTPMGDTPQDGDIGPTPCESLVSDYSPGADDEWPECISDDNTYHQIQDSISTIGRVAGFEEVADLLWRDGAPSVDDFIAARDIYATGEGLDSRVQRREDEHYPPVTDPDTGETLRCRDEGVPEMDPLRCVGPAQILPILTDAFREGSLGNDPEINAARVEAGLLWFLYVSTHKEAVTCASAAKDCDSSYAYYTGGVPRDQGLGLAGYIQQFAPESHDRIWDGILAVRCWRDLDPAETAEDVEAQMRAVAQLDTALLHGVAQVLIARLGEYAAASGVEQEAHAAFLEIFGPIVVREAVARDATAGERLESLWEAGDFSGSFATEVTELTETLFPCP